MRSLSQLSSLVAPALIAAEMGVAPGCAEGEIPEISGQTCLADWQDHGARRVAEAIYITPQLAEDPALLVDTNDDSGRIEYTVVDQFYASTDPGESLDLKTLVNQNRLVAVTVPGSNAEEANPDYAFDAEVDTKGNAEVFSYDFDDSVYATTPFYGKESGHFSTAFFQVTGERNPKCEVIETLNGDWESTFHIDEESGEVRDVD